MNRKNNSGFSLLEVIIVMGIVGIALSIAIPSFSDTIDSTRTSNYSNDFLVSLAFSRSEAIKRGMPVSITKQSPTAGHWEGGWNIFVDINSDGTFTDNGDATLCESTEDCLLKIYPSIPSEYTIKVANVYQSTITFKSNGLMTDTTGGVFNVCKVSGTTKSKSIQINSTGRAKVSTPAVTCS